MFISTFAISSKSLYNLLLDDLWTYAEVFWQEKLPIFLYYPLKAVGSAVRLRKSLSLSSSFSQTFWVTLTSMKSCGTMAFGYTDLGLHIFAIWSEVENWILVVPPMYLLPASFFNTFIIFLFLARQRPHEALILPFLIFHLRLFIFIFSLRLLKASGVFYSASYTQRSSWRYQYFSHWSGTYLCPKKLKKKSFRVSPPLLVCIR